MSAARIFQIENGEVAFALVDTGAVGYLDTWQAPSGKTSATATLADYDTHAAHWMCQVTSGALNSSANDNDVTVPATFCQASKVVPQPGETSYTLDLEFLQDPILVNGLSQFLFDNDTDEAYFLLGLNGGDPPQAVGRVRLQAGSFGGPARENLTATISLKATRKPDIAWGTEAAPTMAATETASEDNLVGV
jgi:hypothetical protein